MVDVKRTGNGFAELDVALKALKGWEGRTGFFEDATYPNGTKVAYVAAIQELGYEEGGIPARPFMRPAVTKNKSRWSDFAARIAKRILKGTQTAQGGMEDLAEFAAEDVKQAIEAVTTPTLKPGTLAARRAKGRTSDKPLIDTKLMIRSVQGKAVEE